MRKREAPYPSNRSPKREKKELPTEPTSKSIINQRCLNDLAWLLETSPSSCAAVCMVGRTLMIADNAIYEGSKGASKNKDVRYKHEFIKNIQKYLKTKKFDDRLDVMKSIFEHVFMTKVPLLSKGDIVAPFKKSEVKEIVAAFIKNPNAPIKKLIKSLTFSHNGEKISHLFQMASKIKRRLFRFMSNLAHGDNADLLTSLFNSSKVQDYKFTSKNGVLKQHKKHIVDDKNPMVLILKIDKKSVHAELKIVDMLVGLGLISLKDVGDNTFIIGVSKKCCPQCDTIIKAVNEQSKSKTLITSGTHAVVTKKWLPPIFYSDSTDDDKNTVRWDNELIKKARAYFEEIDFMSEDEHNSMSQESEGEVSEEVEKVEKVSPSTLTNCELLDLLTKRFKENAKVLQSLDSLSEEIKKASGKTPFSDQKIHAVKAVTSNYHIFVNIMSFLQGAELLKLRLVDTTTKKHVTKYIDNEFARILRNSDDEKIEDVGHSNTFN